MNQLKKITLSWIALGLICIPISGCGSNSVKVVKKAPGFGEEVTNFYIGEEGYRRDAVELKPRHKPVFEKVDAEVASALKASGYEGGFGAIHAFWIEKKTILKQRYDIEWRSPRELNPDISFD